MTLPPNFCPACGSTVAAVERFCHSCGASLADVFAVVTQPLPPPEPEPLAEPRPNPPPVPAAAAPPPAAPPVDVRPDASPQIFRVVNLTVALMLVVASLGFGITLVLGGGSQPPASSDTAPTTGRQVIDVKNIKVEIPADWDVLSRSGDTIAVADPTGRTLWLRSAAVTSALTLDTLQERFLDKARREAPDARICAGPEAAVVPGGPIGGRYVVICSTFIPQGGGPAVRFADAYYIGLDGQGTTVFVMQLTASPESLQGFATAVQGLPPPLWKLFRP